MTLHHDPNKHTLSPPERVYTATGYGVVGQGRTPEEAKRDLLEKMREAREA